MKKHPATAKDTPSCESACPNCRPELLCQLVSNLLSPMACIADGSSPRARPSPGWREPAQPNPGGHPRPSHAHTYRPFSYSERSRGQRKKEYSGSRIDLGLSASPRTRFGHDENARGRLATV